jgi:SpoIIAA-like
LIENVTDLPPGTLGFRASGKVTNDEYRQMMEPIYAALERGEKLNVYFELADDFHGLDLGALWQDVKAAGWSG